MTHNNDERQISPVDALVAGDNVSDCILVIDSGVGGLSVCQSILSQQPTLKIIYFADSEYFPYGLLPEQDLSQRLKIIVKKMLDMHQPKLVVLACNTVSTLVLPELRALFDIPFVGVVPAIKPAALMSEIKCIGLLATPATIIRPYTDQLIKDYANACQVVKVGSSELVIEAEKLLNGQRVCSEVMAKVLAPFNAQQDKACVDTVVLGCTHFPLLKDFLGRCLPSVSWIDSGDAIANRVTHLLGEQEKFIKLSSDKITHDGHQLYFSQLTRHNEKFSIALNQLGFKKFTLHYINSI